MEKISTTSLALTFSVAITIFGCSRTLVALKLGGWDYGNARISIGYDITPEKDLFFVTIGNNECSGVLVAPNFILTAASCVTGQPLEKKVKGGYNKGNNGITYMHEALIKRVCIPTDFDVRPDGGYRNNYALVFLDRRMPKSVKPLELKSYDPSYQWFKGSENNCTMLGVGKSNLAPGSVTYNDVIIRDCQGIQDNSTICFRVKDSGTAAVACQGDQGGPILCERTVDGVTRRKLVGLTSRVSKDCRAFDATRQLMEASNIMLFYKTSYNDCAEYIQNKEDVAPEPI